MTCTRHLIELDTTQSCATSAPAKRTSRCGAPRATNRPGWSAAALRRRMDALLQPGLCRTPRRPQTRAELKSHALVGGGGGSLCDAYEAWIQRAWHRRAGRDATSVFGRPAPGVRSGFGIAVLPCMLGDGEPDLVRCMPPRDDHGRVLWLFTHERVRHTPRVRAVIDFLYEKLSRQIRELEEKRAAA